MNNKNIFIAILLLIILGACSRLLEHAPNFTPIAAIAIFTGYFLPRKISLIIAPLILLISDLFIGFYQPSLMIIVYGSFILSVIFGWWLKNNFKWYNIALTAILSGLIFFIITNFAVWALTPWYPKSIPGLLYCCYLALPFFRNTLLGNLFYSTILFGAYQLINLLIMNKIKQRLSNYLTIYK